MPEVGLSHREYVELDAAIGVESRPIQNQALRTLARLHCELYGVEAQDCPDCDELHEGLIGRLTIP
jgi:hypothetical protein